MPELPTPDRWPRIAPLLEQALDLPAERRGAFLDQACKGDPGLRAEIDSLLSADAEAGSFLGAPVDLSVVASPEGPEPGAASGDARGPTGSPAPVAGTTIGPYRLVREIGRGGMGVVYEAEQQRPRRPVALKLILAGRHADAEAVRLFMRESESLARLKHPGIAAIYESGTTDEGQHFFAMELVPGRTLSDDLERAGPPASRRDLRLRLALFRRIASAVAYAHQRGVIHRDLKPSNILVLEPVGGAGPRGGGSVVSGNSGDADGAPEIKILDFGLARITDPDAGEATAVSAIGHIQGTLPYMSPEQVRGRREEVDVRTDVYSLGVILYRMLTGRPPYDLDGKELPEAARIVCEQAPLPLTAPAGGAVRIDRDLSTIVLKALEKDPARRYQGVAALDVDVARYLDGQPILARPPTAAYQIRKLVARHKIPFAAAGVLVILLVGFATTVTLQAQRIAAERDRANREAKTTQEVSDFMTDLFKVSDPSEAKGNEVTAREILDRGLQKIETELADEPEVQARLLQAMGGVYESLGLYEKSTPLLEKSLELRRRLLGEEHLETLAAMDRLAVQYNRLGRTPEAERLFSRVLELRRRLQGEDHPDTLQTMDGLASVYCRQGRYGECEELDRNVLEARRRVLGEDHQDTVSSMIHLGIAYRQQRRYADAEALYRPALESQRRVLGDDHPSTCVTMQDLASVYRHQGRFAEAEELLREARDRERRVLGEDHPQTLWSMNQLGILLYDLHRYADAEPLLRDTLDRRRRVLGEAHDDTLVTMNVLGNVLSAQGRYPDAEALFREALDRQRRLLGEDHPHTNDTRYNLGCLAARRGARTEAYDWLGQAVAHGYSDAALMTQDPDLKSLRGDPAFEALVARARENAGK